MRRVAAAALVVFSAVLPACAQRTTSHASAPVVRTAPAFRGSYGAPGPRQPPAVRSYPAARGYSAPRAFLRPAIGAHPARPPYSGDLRHRRPPYRAPYGILGYGVYAYPGYLGSGDLGYSDDGGYDDSQPVENDANAPEQYIDGGYEDQQPDQQQLPPWPYGGAQQGPAYGQPAPPPPPEAAVTLIFKDGRPPEQIHNYLVTKGTLYVDDPHRREIPIDELDLAATAKANRDAGVDFRIPAMPGS
jgi:hypothetical protein